MEVVFPLEQYRQTDTVSFKYARGNIGIYPKIFHQHHELFLLLNGNVEFISENDRSFIQPNTLVIIPQGVYHQFIVHSDISQYERCVLEIELSHKAAEHFCSILQKQAIYQLPSDSGILDAFSRLHKYIEESYADDYPYLVEAVTAEILFLLCHEQLPSPKKGEALNPLSRKAMEYIHAHLDRPISLKKVSEASFAAPSTLSHAFRNSYGISVMQYVQNKKMAMAKHYIMKGDSPGEACRKCGYTEYSTFFRAYVKEFGCSPSLDESDMGKNLHTPYNTNEDLGEK